MTFPTWSDPSNPPIVPPLGNRAAKDLGPLGILTATEPDLHLVRSGFTAPKSKNFLLGSLVVDGKNPMGLCLAGPYIGAPYAAMLMESLVARGVKQILILGWCGALDPQLSPGDLLLVEGALAEEGTSKSYLPLEDAHSLVRPHLGLFNGLAAHLEEESIPHVRGKIWTTDAIYRETRDKADHFTGLGALAVEMECSALFAVGAHRNIPVAALLVVSDSLAQDEWKPGFSKKEFKAGRRRASDALMAFAKNKLAIPNG